jgi:hypothetical protein
MALDTANGRHRDLTGWNVAAALGLLAAAFLVERLVPAKNEDLPERKTKRDTSAVGLAERRDRGRLAASPSEIPATGWKDILLRAYTNVGDHRILALAAGMTYYSLLSTACLRTRAPSPSTSTRCQDSCRAAPSTWRASSSRVSRRRETRRSV